LWAQIGFIATIIDQTSASGCQVVIIFASAFDQLARVAVEQYLVWAVNSGSRTSAATLIPQLLVLARFILGATFVGLSRPQFAPVCVASQSVLPVGVATAALDAVLVVVVLARAFQVGLVSEMQARGAGAMRSQAVIFVILGFTLWTGVSVNCFSWRDH